MLFDPEVAKIAAKPCIYLIMLQNRALTKKCSKIIEKIEKIKNPDL